MKKIVIIIIVLAVIAGGAAYLNRGNLAMKKQSQDNAVFQVKAQGGEAVNVDMKTVASLDKTDFKANLKKNGKPPVEHKFTGALLKKVLENAGVKLDGKSKVIVKSVDGYTSVLTVDEVKEDDNVYVTYSMDGKSLGKKEDGGSGPFMILIRKDQYSQRWSKFASEVEVQ